MEDSHLPLVLGALILASFINGVHVTSLFSNCPNNTFKATTGVIEVSWTEPIFSQPPGRSITVLSSHPGQQSLSLRPSNNKTQVTYSAINETGNTVEECKFNIYVVDPGGDLPVIFDCPVDDIERKASSLEDSVYVSWEEPRAVDEGGELALDHTNHEDPSGTFNVGHTVVLYRWVDSPESCTFTVIVTAPEPNITCPDDITREVPSQDFLVKVTWETPRPASKNVTLIRQSHNSTGGIFGVGVTEVGFYWVDNAGQSAQCTFSVTVTVREYAPPEVIGCPDNITREVLSNGDFTNVTWVEPRAESDAGKVTLLSQSVTSGKLFGVGITRVDYSWEDIAGKTASCTFFINVVVKPVKQPPWWNPLCLSDEILIGIGAGLLLFVVLVIACMIKCCKCKSSNNNDRRRSRPHHPPPPYAPRNDNPHGHNPVPLKTISTGNNDTKRRALPRTPVMTPDEEDEPPSYLYPYETPINDQYNEDYLQPNVNPPRYYSHNINN